MVCRHTEDWHDMAMASSDEAPLLHTHHPQARVRHLHTCVCVHNWYIPIVCHFLHHHLRKSPWWHTTRVMAQYVHIAGAKIVVMPSGPLTMFVCTIKESFFERYLCDVLGCV